MLKKSAIVTTLIGSAALGVAAWIATGRFESSSDSYPQRGAQPPPVTDAVAPRSSQQVVAERQMIFTTSSPDRVFTDVPDASLDHAVIEDFLLRRPLAAYRIVSVNSDLLRERVRNIDTDQTIELALLGSEPQAFVSVGAKEHSEGWQTGFSTWVGQIESDETSRISFVVSPDGSVNGVLQSAESGRIKIEPIKGTPHHIIWQAGPIKRRID